ncbi:MAG: hypothetical protein JWL68_4069 [Actinomycetia bacterium]|jgi:hypothetical protein|nr:hypothetical protein [Actinomycetes bacterium]
MHETATALPRPPPPRASRHPSSVARAPEARGWRPAWARRGPGYGAGVGRAVIIGGTGAIGRATARRLLARGEEDAALIPGSGDCYFAPLLDYPAEDRRLAARMGSAG